jgi:hypothetical protein
MSWRLFSSSIWLMCMNGWFDFYSLNYYAFGVHIFSSLHVLYRVNRRYLGLRHPYCGTCRDIIMVPTYLPYYSVARNCRNTKSILITRNLMSSPEFNQRSGYVQEKRFYQIDNISEIPGRYNKITNITYFRYSRLILHTNIPLTLFPRRGAEAFQIYLQDAHVLQKVLSYEEYCRCDRW